MLTFKELSSLVHMTVGLRIREQNADPVRKWLKDRAAGHGLAVAAYLCLLREDSQSGRCEREHLTVMLTTGETYFFRDQALFSLLSRDLIPRLLRTRANQRKLRIWSAGCSTGEEAYSLAMLMNEHAHLLKGWDVEIFASDINTEALGIARRGLYRDWSFRSMDELRRQKFFHRRDRLWEIDESLRQSVRFVHLDLFKDVFPNPDIGMAGFDLIICRNVFIYMQPDAVACVVEKLNKALVDDGYLIAGHGELLGHNMHGLRTRVFPEAVIFHKTLLSETWEEPSGQSFAAPSVKMPLRLKELKKPKPQATQIPHRKAQHPPPVRASNDETLMQHAWACANRGDNAAAHSLCEQATALQPLDPWPYYLKAQLAQESGEISRAREMLDRVIYLDPAHIAAYIELAALHEHDGNVERARKMRLAACRELKKMAPEAKIRPYENSTAEEMLAYIEGHIDEEAVVVPAGHAAYTQDNRMRRHGT